MPAAPSTCPASNSSKVTSSPPAERSPSSVCWRPQRHLLPLAHAVVHLAMGEERVVLQAQLLALAQHHVHGIVQHDLAERGGGGCHENGRLVLPAGQDGQGPEVIVVRMGEEDRIHPLLSRAARNPAWRFPPPASGACRYPERRSGPPGSAHNNSRRSRYGGSDLETAFRGDQDLW